MHDVLDEAVRLTGKIPMGLRRVKVNLDTIEWRGVKDGDRFEET